MSAQDVLDVIRHLIHSQIFKSWGEGGDIYAGEQSSVDTHFNNQSGRYVST